MLFDEVRRQVERLIPAFGVGAQWRTILASFDHLCSESLDLGHARRAPELMHLNTDGTPFQFSLSLDRLARPPLQFLCEAGRPGAAMDQRVRASYRRAHDIGRACGLTTEVDDILPMLRELVPENDPAVSRDSSSMFWIALSFAQGVAPTLTVYINARWDPRRRGGAVWIVSEH